MSYALHNNLGKKCNILVYLLKLKIQNVLTAKSAYGTSLHHVK